jgi:hypothetical protein
MNAAAAALPGTGAHAAEDRTVSRVIQAVRLRGDATGWTIATTRAGVWEQFEAPELGVPVIEVDTGRGYDPDLPTLARLVRSTAKETPHRGRRPAPV